MKTSTTLVSVAAASMLPLGALADSAANKALVLDALGNALLAGNPDAVPQYFAEDIIQHNRMVADGLEGFGAFMAQMAEQGISMDSTEVHHVISEGNFVVPLSKGALVGEPTAFYDLVRLEVGLIVKHWDVSSPMPVEDAPHNEAGKF